MFEFNGSVFYSVGELFGPMKCEACKTKEPAWKLKLSKEESAKVETRVENGEHPIGVIFKEKYGISLCGECFEKEKEEPMPEDPKNCLSCGKDDNKTGSPCPTRTGCHYPDYDNWEPVGSDEEKKTGWELISFSWAKFDDSIMVNLQHKGCGVIMVTMSPDDIAGLALPKKLKEEIDNKL